MQKIFSITMLALSMMLTINVNAQNVLGSLSKKMGEDSKRKEKIDKSINSIEAKFKDSFFIKSTNLLNDHSGLDSDLFYSIEKLSSNIDDYKKINAKKKKKKKVIAEFELKKEGLIKRYDELLAKKIEVFSFIERVEKMEFKPLNPDRCNYIEKDYTTVFLILNEAASWKKQRIEYSDYLNEQSNRIKKVDKKIEELSAISNNKDKLLSCLSKRIDFVNTSLDETYQEHKMKAKTVLSHLKNQLVLVTMYQEEKQTLTANQKEKFDYYSPKKAELEEYISSGRYEEHVINERRMVNPDVPSERKLPISSALNNSIIESLKYRVDGPIKRLVALSNESKSDSRGHVWRKVSVATHSKENPGKCYLYKFKTTYIKGTNTIVKSKSIGKEKRVEIRKENILK